jgi:hypothetical protein
MYEPLVTLRQSLLVTLGLGACSPSGVAAPREEPRSNPSSGAEGYVREPDGTVHRASLETCDPSTSAAACTTPSPHGNECTRVEDCQAGAYPQCVQDSGQLGEFCRCDYGCQTDADCQPDQVCVCSGAFSDGSRSRCVSARCRVDADCESNTCGLSSYFDGCQRREVLACRSAGDACRTDADCDDGRTCAYDPHDDRWDCRGQFCAIGRPLVIDGVARTAPAVARADWLTELDLPRDLPRAVRDALAARWSEIAALEHASVASFAGFTLDLMSLGAPPDLLAEAQRAALDEIEHARLAWSLASLWSGRPLGPGPLSLDGFPLRHGLEDIVRALVREGCVGETLGAAEAQFCAELADHPAMSPLFDRIARDEARHAAFAWRTLRWLLSTRGNDVLLLALTTVAELRAEIAGDLPPDDDDALSAPTWGLLRPSELLAHRRETFAVVIDPVLRALLGPTAAA